MVTGGQTWLFWRSASAIQPPSHHAASSRQSLQLSPSPSPDPHGCPGGTSRSPRLCYGHQTGSGWYPKIAGIYGWFPQWKYGKNVWIDPSPQFGKLHFFWVKSPCFVTMQSVQGTPAACGRGADSRVAPQSPCIRVGFGPWTQKPRENSVQFHGVKKRYFNEIYFHEIWPTIMYT